MKNVYPRKHRHKVVYRPSRRVQRRNPVENLGMWMTRIESANARSLRTIIEFEPREQLIHDERAAA